MEFVQETDPEVVKVKIDGFENTDLKKYANVLYNYRNASVYSSPEVLKQIKKLQEPTKAMDVYSFGLIMWELYHSMIPFDGDISNCISCVVQEDLRPEIR